MADEDLMAEGGEASVEDEGAASDGDLMAGLDGSQQGEAGGVLDDETEGGEALGDDVLDGGLASPRPGEDGEEAPDGDLMAGIDDTDLMGGLDDGAEREGGADLMGDLREEGGEALGDDVLGGGLASPRPGEDDEAGVSAEESAEVTGEVSQEPSAELSVEAPSEAVSLGEAQQEQKDMEDAAKKIQTIHRGGRDRAKVADEKARGVLPGQQRARIQAPVTARESEKSEGKIDFYDGIGSSYVGGLLDGHPHGSGAYTFANGNIYKGEFAWGQMQGKGELHYPGYGKLVASFEDGRAQADSQFFFEDGLAYQPQGWKYCVEGDRRFYHEVVDPRFGLQDE
ncbi:hypothetical protein T484DRAFT_1926871 [Baffinella frigidus]|nr:hypothetical protein T484DRAFT_1926871 [Cryptophyta sp. CCMP2293]